MESTEAKEILRLTRVIWSLQETNSQLERRCTELQTQLKRNTSSTSIVGRNAAPPKGNALKRMMSRFTWGKSEEENDSQNRNSAELKQFPTEPLPADNFLEKKTVTSPVSVSQLSLVQQQTLQMIVRGISEIRNTVCVSMPVENFRCEADKVLREALIRIEALSFQETDDSEFNMLLRQERQFETQRAKIRMVIFLMCFHWSKEKKRNTTIQELLRSKILSVRHSSENQTTERFACCSFADKSEAAVNMNDKNAELTHCHDNSAKFNEILVVGRDILVVKTDKVEDTEVFVPEDSDKLLCEPLSTSMAVSDLKRSSQGQPECIQPKVEDSLERDLPALRIIKPIDSCKTLPEGITATGDSDKTGNTIAKESTTKNPEGSTVREFLSTSLQVFPAATRIEDRQSPAHSIRNLANDADLSSIPESVLLAALLERALALQQMYTTFDSQEFIANFPFLFKEQSTGTPKAYSSPSRPEPSNDATYYTAKSPHSRTETLDDFGLEKSPSRLEFVRHRRRRSRSVNSNVDLKESLDIVPAT